METGKSDTSRDKKAEGPARVLHSCGLDSDNSLFLDSLRIPSDGCVNQMEKYCRGKSCDEMKKFQNENYLLRS